MKQISLTPAATLAFTGCGFKEVFMTRKDTFPCERGRCTGPCLYDVRTKWVYRSQISTMYLKPILLLSVSGRVKFKNLKIL